MVYGSSPISTETGKPDDELQFRHDKLKAPSKALVIQQRDRVYGEEDEHWRDNRSGRNDTDRL